LEGSSAADREELLALLSGKHQRSSEELVERVRVLFTRAAVFVKAEKLIEKYRARAEAIADEIEPVELRELLYYLVDTVLDRPTATPQPVLLQLGV
jgi:geranylgeranyl pyrophosphate synthase